MKISALVLASLLKFFGTCRRKSLFCISHCGFFGLALGFALALGLAFDLALGGAFNLVFLVALGLAAVVAKAALIGVFR